MAKVRPYILDVVIALVLILLPGIRGYANWQIHEYLLILMIYMYIVILHHRKK